MISPIFRIIQTNTQKWTPFAVILVILTTTFCGILLWDIIHNINPPLYVLTILGILGGSGVFQVGHSAANGVAQRAATATATGVVNGLTPLLNQQSAATNLNTAATNITNQAAVDAIDTTKENTKATEENTIATEQQNKGVKQ